MAARNWGASDAKLEVQDPFNRGFRRLPFDFTPALNVRYTMRGFYAAINDYVYWPTTNPEAGNPYGLTLQNVGIASVIENKSIYLRNDLQRRLWLPTQPILYLFPSGSLRFLRTFCVIRTNDLIFIAQKVNYDQHVATLSFLLK